MTNDPSLITHKIGDALARQACLEDGAAKFNEELILRLSLLRRAANTDVRRTRRGASIPTVNAADGDAAAYQGACARRSALDALLGTAFTQGQSNRQ